MENFKAIIAVLDFVLIIVAIIILIICIIAYIADLEDWAFGLFLIALLIGGFILANFICITN